jgi:hypothetical protein
MHRGGFLMVFVYMSAITLLMDWYVIHGLRTFNCRLAIAPYAAGRYFGACLLYR